MLKNGGKAVEMIQKELENVGFSQKEAEVYLAVLELGNGSAQMVTEKSGLPKSTTYDVLKSLSKKRLINIYLKGNRKRFSVSDPTILKEQIKKQEVVLTALLPKLEAMYGTKINKPKIRVYEGKSGVDVILKEILNEAKELISLSSAEDVFDKLRDHFPDFSKERARRKIPLRLITQDSPKARERQQSGPQELRRVKILDFPVPFKSLNFIWQNKIAMITLGEDLIILVLESKDLADTWKAIFELLWAKQ